MKILLNIAIITAFAAFLWALHRLALWLEDRGWIYYRRRSGSGGSAVGNALHELHSFFETDVRKAQEEIMEEKEERSDIGAPPFKEKPEPREDNDK
ncbi:MAG: hypothetical protein AB1656_27070 [Candidatus Omnitrophota bacterium]